MTTDRTALATRIAALSPERRAALLGKVGARQTPPPAAETIRPRQPPGCAASLSFGQQRLWLIDRLMPGNAAYNETNLLPLPFPVDTAALRWALDEILRRHEILRSRFPMEDGAPLQVPLAQLSLDMPLADLRHFPAGEREAEMLRLAQEQSRRPFDLDADPPIRAMLLRLAPDNHALALTVHHIATDGWSLGVFVVELLTLYWSRQAGQPSPLPEPQLQYADFACWQRRSLDGAALAPQIAYWRRQLAGLPLLELPADRPRPREFSHRGARLPLSIPPPLEAALKRLAEREGTTLHVVALAGLFALLRRITGQDDLAVGCPSAGRHRKELQPLMGFFVNTLVLRVDSFGGASFSELVRRVREAMVAAMAHQDVPFERLVDELQPPRDKSHSPFFQVMFQLFQPPSVLGVPLALRPRLTPVDAGTAKFDLTVELIRTEEEGIRGHLEYNTDLFDRGRIERLSAHYVRLLDDAAADPSRTLSALALLSAEEEQRLRERNATAAPYPRDATLPEVFQAQAAATPDAPALRWGGNASTYAELAKRAAAVAAGLHSVGVRRGDLVGLHMERGPELPAVLLGILNAGAAYVPLDPAYPRDRLDFLLEDSGARVVVAQDGQTPALRDFPGAVLDAVALAGAAAAGPSPLERPGPEDLAYVMYTSGTTGRPKGVAVTHRNILRLVKGVDYADWRPGNAVLQFAPLSFDASTLEIWGCLLNGGTLVPHPRGTPSLAELGAFIRRERLDLVFLTTALFRQMVEAQAADLRGVRQVLTGGEAMSAASARAAWRALPRSNVVNCYGPTECTVIGTTWRLAGTDVPDGGAPIGRPIANTTAHVLDADGCQLPDGVPGELWLGGDGVAAGYWRQPALTEERFRPDPFSDTPGARLYRTGDIVAWRADGELLFQGRADRQVKLNGYRIELAEVESAMEAHPGVSAAVALLAGPAELPRLVGFAARAEGARLTEAELRRFLQERLPKHMLPAAIKLRDRLPTTPAGKLDHAALAAAAEAPGETQEAGRAPLPGIEQRIAAQWEELLELRGIGRNDSFFDLGGHSLVAMRLLSRLRAELGAEVTMAAFFDDPTVAGLAALLQPEAVPK